MQLPRRSVLVFATSMAGVVALALGFERMPQSRDVRGQAWGLSQANFHEFREMLTARKLPKLDARFSFSLESHETAAVQGRWVGRPDQGSGTLEFLGSERIYYTLDGSIPTRRSRVYRQPVRLDTSAVVRARHLPRGMIPGPILTWHHIDLPDSGLPVLSVAMDPVDLWNKYVGIYANPLSRGRQWERHGHVGYRSPGSDKVAGFAAEVRIHGGYSRHSPKKSLRVRFSTDSLPFPDDHLLVSTAVNGENMVVLRTTVNPATAIRDAVANAMYDDLGGVVSRAQPVELMLNGEYWGLYHLRERVADGFLQLHFGPGEYEALKHDSENARDWLTPESGTRDGWDSTLVRLERIDVASREGLDSATVMFDIDETIDYWIHNIYTANIDWPYNNAHVFRRLDGNDRRWRWLSWDLDPTFIHVRHNTLAWALRDTVRNDLKWNYRPGVMEDQPHQVVSTLPVRLLLRSPEIRNRFAARAQILLQLHYTEASVRSRLRAILDSQSAAFERDAERWGWTEQQLSEALQLLGLFARERPKHMREHLASYFELGPPVRVRIWNAPGQTLLAERYTLPAGTTELQLMRGTKLRLTAMNDGGHPITSILDVQADTLVEIRSVP